MAILVELWGKAVTDAAAVQKQVIAKRNAQSPEYAQQLSYMLFSQARDRFLSWPVNVGVTHISITFDTKEEFKSYRDEFIKRHLVPQGAGAGKKSTSNGKITYIPYTFG